jgi:hypothetical protein
MVVSGTTDQRIADVAKRQRDRISRSQLRAIGISDAAIVSPLRHLRFATRAI